MVVYCNLRMQWHGDVRNGMDGERAHHHGGHRLRRALPRLVDGATRLDRRARDAGALLDHHLLHLQPSRRLLPHRRPGVREEELHLHGRRRIVLGYVLLILLIFTCGKTSSHISDEFRHGRR
jgi:hypothetical protein